MWYFRSLNPSYKVVLRMSGHLLANLGARIMLKFTRYLVVLLAVLTFSAPTTALATSASGPVTDFQAGLVSVMQRADKLGVSGRYKELVPLVSRNFNMPLMAALAAGPYWNTATEDQRAELIEAFQRVSVATLATLFSGYSGETFNQVGEREAPGNITFVDTRLVIPGRSDDVQLTYVARQFDGNWRLIDVIVDSGISELKVRISEYNQTLKTGGITALTDLLNNKADELLR